jgi:5'-nucleotidase (lipoprotein e(P4) family)
MKQLAYLSFVLIVFLSISCNNKKDEEQEIIKKTSSFDLSQQLMMSTLWQQTAGEYDALCFQAFNLAKMQIDNMLANNIDPSQSAIVVDIDETMIDNSFYEAELILSKKIYSSEDWNDWCRLLKAEAVPGALDFMNYASEKGFQLYYISNRKEEVETETIENLKAIGFPMADKEHVFIRTEESSKLNRRAMVEENYKIVLLIGDNLADFSEKFEGLTIEERSSQVDNDKASFGVNYIVLPNPMYGDWEGAIYDGDFGISDTLKNEKRNQALKGYLNNN